MAERQRAERSRRCSCSRSRFLLRVERPAAARPSDFNGDGYADLAIGAKQSEAGDDAGGTVNVIYGSSGGLTAAGDQLWSQDSPGVKGVASGWDDAEDETWSPGDEFGAALASGDFDRDGFADLAIGAPSDGETGVRRGAVNVLYGASTGLTAAGDQLWTRNNIPGQADVPGSLGAVLEAADFNGDGFADLAIATFDATGAVRLLFGSAGGLTTIGSLLLTAGSPLVPDSVTDGWFFGAVPRVRGHRRGRSCRARDRLRLRGRRRPHQPGCRRAAVRRRGRLSD